MRNSARGVLPVVWLLAACPGGDPAASDPQATDDGTTDLTSDTAATVPTTGDAPDSDGPDSTGPGACDEPADCGGDRCHVAVDCRAGTCVFEDMPEGTALPAQTPGDCAVAVCDGKGGVAAEPDPADLPDDGIDCSADACDGLTPVSTLQSETCYSGRPGTADVGACVAGTRTCDPALNDYGPCEGEVVPAVEDCDPAHLDEDCDGKVDEDGPSCACGDDIVSAGELCDDGDTLDNGCAADCASEQRVLEIAIGDRHNCALLTGGRVKCWGEGESGKTGHGDTLARGDDPGEMGAGLAFTDLGAGQTATAISAGKTHSCAVLAGGKLKCWGHNTVGQLGLGDTQNRGDQPNEMGDALPFVDLGDGAVVAAVSAGDFYTCALLVGGAVKCWGWNTLGSLGLGDNDWRGDGPNEMGDNLPAVDLGQGQAAVAISAGHQHTCALLDGGAVKCWGRNEAGALGLGDSEHRGDQPGEMGDALPFVDLGQDVLATAVVVGNDHACALLSDDRIKCWGGNFVGTLGLGDTENRGDDPDEMGDALPFVDLGPGPPAVTVLASTFSSCALLADGVVKCWGENGLATLGLGYVGGVIGDQPNEMGANLAAAELGVGIVVSGLYTTRANSGDATPCVVLSDGAAKCWGLNSDGRLGLETTEIFIGDTPDEMGDGLPRIRLYSDVW